MKFHATIAYTCKIYQKPGVLSEYDHLWNNNENSGVSKGNYIWYEYDDPKKFYAVIQKVAEFLKTMYRSLDQNSLLVELNGYIYNLTDYYVYRKFLDAFERSF
jgi:hypothetical protein